MGEGKTQRAGKRAGVRIRTGRSVEKLEEGKLLGEQVKYAAGNLGLGREVGLTTPRRAFRSGVREAAAA